MSKITNISTQIIRLMALIAVFTAVIVFTIGVNARLFLTEKEEHQERDYLAMKIKDELHVKNDVGIIAAVELSEMEELQVALINKDPKVLILSSKKWRIRLKIKQITKVFVFTLRQLI